MNALLFLLSVGCHFCCCRRRCSPPLFDHPNIVGSLSIVGSALAVVAARPQRGCSKQRCDGVCSAVLAEAVWWQHQQSSRDSMAEAR